VDTNWVLKKLIFVNFNPHFLARRLWKEYFTDDVSAVVFLVDAAEPQRFGEAKRELDVCIIVLLTF